MIKDLVSIVIPVCNRPDALERTLKGIEKQTYPHIEVIVVDDGSTESPDEVVKKYKVKKYIKKENGGAPSARNRGFKESEGEYILFCDGDIILKPEAIQEMYASLVNNPEAAFTYSSWKIGRKKFKAQEFNVDKLKENNYISTMSLLRREYFPGFDESLKRFQDWDLWLTIVENGGVGVPIHKLLWKAEATGTISSWLPSFFYKLFPNNKKVQKYKKAKEIVQKKHGLI